MVAFKKTRKSEEVFHPELRRAECLRPRILRHPFGNGNAARGRLNDECPRWSLNDTSAAKALTCERVIAVGYLDKAGTGIVC